MGQLAKNNRQLIYIFSEKSRLGKQILAYVKTINRPVRIINLDNESIADTIWIEIASMLNTSLGDLFSKKKTIKESANLSASDWLKIINHSPSVLQRPIAINGTMAKQIKEKHQIFSFFNPTGGDLVKHTQAIQYANNRDTTHYKNTL